MIQELVKSNDPILLQIAEEIPIAKITSKTTKKFIEKMLDASYGRRKDKSKPYVVGLAAPQIGISKRIIAVDIGADGKGGLSNLRIYINPKITWKSQDEVEWYEGCWSTDSVCGIVSRPNEITVKAVTPEGIEIEETYQGYVARIFQHEIDHLEGKEFVTHITDNNNLHWVESDEFLQYRNNEGWRNWQKKCPREKWEKIKGITKPQPIGVGIVILDKEKKHVLLGKRLNAYRAGMFGLPGGRLEIEETLIDCGKRELLEETGLKAKKLEYIGVVRELQEGYSFIHFAFICSEYTGTPKVIEPNKCESWKWYPLDNLPKNIITGHKATLDLYLHPEKAYRDIVK